MMMLPLCFAYVYVRRCCARERGALQFCQRAATCCRSLHVSHALLPRRFRLFSITPCLMLMLSLMPGYSRYADYCRRCCRFSRFSPLRDDTPPLIATWPRFAFAASAAAQFRSASRAGRSASPPLILADRCHYADAFIFATAFA